MACLKSAFCCCDLRAGVITIISWQILSAIITMLLGGLEVLAAIKLNKLTQTDEKVAAFWSKDNGVLFLYAAIVTIALAFILLVAAITALLPSRRATINAVKYRHAILLYLFCLPVCLIVTIAIGVMFINHPVTPMLVKNKQWYMGFMIGQLVVTGLFNLYCWLVMLSFYQQLNQLTVKNAKEKGDEFAAIPLIYNDEDE